LTGHTLEGASNEVIDLIMKEVQGRIKVKGSGVIRTHAHYLELIDRGVDRLGINCTSAKRVLGLEE
jgi:deoxyribose-phosphate aldolase